MGRANRAFARRERLAVIERCYALLARLDSYHGVSLRGRPSDWWFQLVAAKNLSLADLKAEEAELSDWLAELDSEPSLDASFRTRETSAPLRRPDTDGAPSHDTDTN